MTDQAEPGRPPAHDLAAFDVSKRSPEQIAQAFARWKEQRKRQGPEPARAGQPPYPRPLPAIARGAAQESPPVSEEKPRTIQYSTPFAALLAAGSEPTLAHRIWYPDVRLPRLRRPQPSRRRPKATWALTGVASIVAVAAMASGALLEQSQWRGPVETEPSAAQIHPLDIPFVATATAARGAEWKLQQTIDLALMTAVPTIEAVHPPAPVVRTASKAAAQPLSEPKREVAAPEPLQFVPKPFVPSVAPATATSPVVPVAAAGLGGDPRPDALVQHGHDKSKNALGANNRVAAPGSKPAGVAGSGGSADPRSASSRSGGAATGGASDPASGATGGDGTGDGSGAGGDTGSGDTGSGDSGGGDTGGDTGGGDAGGGDAGGESGGDTGGGETGGRDTDGESSGDAGDGDSGGGDSGSGDGSGESGSAGSGDVGNGGGGSEDKNKDKSD